MPPKWFIHFLLAYMAKLWYFTFVKWMNLSKWFYIGVWMILVIKYCNFVSILYKIVALILSEFVLVLCRVGKISRVQVVVPKHICFDIIVAGSNHLSVYEFGHHWLRSGLVAHWASGHSMNQWSSIGLVQWSLFFRAGACWVAIIRPWHEAILIDYQCDVWRVSIGVG